MTATVLDIARLLIGFALGYAATRAASPCPVCGQLGTLAGRCDRCAPAVVGATVTEAR